MSGRQAKASRQIAKTALEELQPLLDGRLDRIEMYVRDKIGAMEKQEKAIRGWLIGEVKVKLQNDLFNANCTVDAVVEVLAEAGINIPDFASKVDEKKKIVAQRKVKEAEEAMAAQMQIQQAAQEKPAAST